MTWAPDDGPIQTLTVDIAEAWLKEFRNLIGTPEWAGSEAVMWIRYRTGEEGPMAKGLFRLARITALEPIRADDGETP
jgi:hypothetical protein